MRHDPERVRSRHHQRRALLGARAASPPASPTLPAPRSRLLTSRRPARASPRSRPAQVQRIKLNAQSTVTRTHHAAAAMDKAEAGGGIRGAVLPLVPVHRRQGGEPLRSGPPSFIPITDAVTRQAVEEAVLRVKAVEAAAAVTHREVQAAQTAVVQSDLRQQAEAVVDGTACVLKTGRPPLPSRRGCSAFSARHSQASPTGRLACHDTNRQRQLADAQLQVGHLACSSQLYMR